MSPKIMGNSIIKMIYKTVEGIW